LVAEFQPDLIGIGMYASTYALGTEIARLSKSVYPKAKVVVGGPFASFVYEQFLAENDAVDFIVCYEGEYPMLDVARRIQHGKDSMHDVPGLVFRENGQLVVVKSRPRLKNLDALPFPNRGLVKQQSYSDPFTISTARGCPSNCIFCSSKAFWGKGCVSRTAENIVSEIQYLYNEYPEMRTFHFADDTFLFDRQRVIRICDLLVRSGMNLRWGCLARVDEIDKELVVAMYAAGCNHVKFGIESGSDKVLSRLGKRITLRQIEDAAKLMHDIKIRTVGSVILGLPHDTIETMRETINFARHLSEEYEMKMQVTLNTPFPGTPQYENAEKMGLTIHTRDWNMYNLRHPIISTKNFTRRDLYELHFEAVEQAVLKRSVGYD
jgi:radical SAM superfamily enzyme YgiQ (UPF0313 family)